MARKKKPEDPKIDDTRESVDAVILPEDDTDMKTPDEAAETPATDETDKATDAPATDAADAATVEGSAARHGTLDEPSGDDSPAAKDSDDTLAATDTPEATEPAEPAQEQDRQDDVRPADELPTDEPDALIAEDDKDRPAQETPAPAPQPAQQVIVRKGGFFSMLLGGIVAAAIGFGAARYVLPEGWPWPGTVDDTLAQDVAAQGSRIDDLADAVSAIDVTPLEDRIAGLGDAVDTLSGRLDDITARLTDLEQRPVAQGDGGGGGDTSALSAELRDLKSSVEAQRNELDAMLADARNQEQQAQESAQQTLARAALTRIQTALDSGSDFSDALGDLRDTGADVPGPLADAAGGVPTLGALQAEFPDAARRALTVSRKAGGETSGLGGFLRTQLGVRSLEPQEGDGPDAVLSRAEAAMREGRLADALSEVAILPPEGQAEMADWVARAETRQNAVTAADDLAQSLTEN